VEQEWTVALGQEVDNYDADNLLNTDPEQLRTYFTAKFTMNLPVISKNDVSVDQREAKIDIGLTQVVSTVAGECTDPVLCSSRHHRTVA